MDHRIDCKYGVNCYQKNPNHLKKYKHPKKETTEELREEPLAKRIKLSKSPEKASTSDDNPTNLKDTNNSSLEQKTIINNSKNVSPQLAEHSAVLQGTKKENGEVTCTSTEIVKNEPTSSTSNPAAFIKEKFLVNMPQDFYDFWEFCKSLNAKSPCEAFTSCGLLLVGPFDVLSGKFDQKSAVDCEYLLHWRYYYDIPEFQTVLKGSEKTGYHIGYFRDEPNEMPVFLASNSANIDGCFHIVGPNIFAAVLSSIDETLKTCNPFTKMKIIALKESLKKKALALNYSLSPKSAEITKRENKVITRTFNKIGFIVPYNRKTQLGYRELAMNNRELKGLLDKMKSCDEKTRDSFMDTLQPVLTNASIALDECDFGTGLELGWDLWFYGVESLDGNAARFMKNSYNLLNRSEFATIIEAHVKRRKRGCNLSII